MKNAYLLNDIPALEEINLTDTFMHLKPIVQNATSNLNDITRIYYGSRSNRLDTKIDKNRHHAITKTLYALAQMTQPEIADYNTKSVFRRRNHIISRYTTENRDNVLTNYEAADVATRSMAHTLHTRTVDFADSAIDAATRSRTLFSTNIYYITQGFTLLSGLLAKETYTGDYIQCPAYELILKKYLNNASFIVYKHKTLPILYVYTNDFDVETEDQTDLYGAITLIEMIAGGLTIPTLSEYTALEPLIPSYEKNLSNLTVAEVISLAKYYITRIVNETLASTNTPESIQQTVQTLKVTLTAANEMLVNFMSAQNLLIIDTAYEEATTARVKNAHNSTIRNAKNNIRDYKEYIAKTEQELMQAEDALYGLEHRTTQKVSILQPFREHPYIKITNIVPESGSVAVRFDLHIVSPLVLLDRSALTSMLSSVSPTRDSVWLSAYNSYANSASESTLTLTEYVDILKEIFIKQTYTPLTEMRIRIKLWRSGNSGVTIEDPVQREHSRITQHLPQPHVTYHWCWGTAETKARQALEKQQVDEAIAYIMGTAQQWNIGDYTVTSKLLYDLFVRRTTLNTFIDNTTKEHISMKKIIEDYLKQKETVPNA